MLTATVTEIARVSAHIGGVTLALSDHNGCGACSTHRRPADVPWQQHAVGCPIRERALSPHAGAAAPPPASRAAISGPAVRGAL